jgi:hypothetical protein
MDTDRYLSGTRRRRIERVVTSQLQDYEHTYRALAADLAQVGFISQASIVHRYTSSGNPGCRCHGAPHTQRHDPYYQWSRGVAGKTVSRRLNQSEAELNRSWIANRRRLERVIAQMEQISAEAGKLLLHQGAPPPRARSTKR